MTELPCIPNGAETQIEIDGILTDANLCNVRAFWSRLEAVGSRRRVAIALTDDNVTLYYPALKRMLSSRNWLLRLEVDDGEILMQPVTIYWTTATGDRSTAYRTEDSSALELEFLYEGERNRKLRSIMLILKEGEDEDLASAIFASSTTGLLRKLSNWLSEYQGSVAPQTINQNGIAVSSSGADFLPSTIGNLESQAIALQAAAQAATLEEGATFREIALTLASGTFNQFFDLITLSGSSFLALEAVSPEEVIYEFTTEFTDGVGYGPADIQRVFAVYEGAIAYGETLESINLISGKFHQVQSWVTADGLTRFGTPVSSQEVFAEEKVIYASPLDASLNLYSTFSLSVI